MLIARRDTQAFAAYFAVLLLSMLAAAGGVAHPLKFQRCQAFPSNFSAVLHVGRQVDHSTTSQN